MSLQQSSAFLYELLRNLKVDLLTAFRTHVAPDWRELDYVPDHNKLYLICEGEGWVKIGGREYYPKPGQLVFMPAHVEQSFSVISDDRYVKYWCHFTSSVGDLDLFQWLEAPFCLDVQDFGSLENLFARLAELHGDGSYLSRILEKAVLTEIIGRFLAEAGAGIRMKPGRDVDVERLGRIERFIEANLPEAVTLEQIAKHVHLHPNYLVRYFNKHFGTSPLKYLNRKRMNKARELIRSTSLTVKEVGERTGFPDTNHFAKAFRRDTGFSPTEYRLQYLQPGGRETR